MIWQNTTDQTILIVEMDVKSKEKTYIHSKKLSGSPPKKDPATFFSDHLVYSLLSKMTDDCHTDSDLWSTCSPEPQGGH